MPLDALFGRKLLTVPAVACEPQIMLQCYFPRRLQLMRSVRCVDSFNPLQCRCNYSATSNDMKLVHWSLMGRLLHFVQRGAWTELGRAGPSSLFWMCLLFCISSLVTIKVVSIVTIGDQLDEHYSFSGCLSYYVISNILLSLCIQFMAK